MRSQELLIDQQRATGIIGMIYITQSYPDKNSVIIKVEGTINGESLPVLEEVYQENLELGRRIAIDLGKISSVGRTGRDFLRQIQNKTQFIDIPIHIQMAIDKRKAMG